MKIGKSVWLNFPKEREDEFYVHHISILPSVNINIDYEFCWFSIELSWLTFSGEIYVEWR